MNAKQTLSIDQTIIGRAKDYARRNNTSLSKMIEAYLESLTSTNSNKQTITPLVQSLSGIIDLPEGYDFYKEYGDHLNRKQR